VILLDTHIWVWWVQGDARLAGGHQQFLIENEPGGLGVSVISCWEVAKLVEGGRLVLPGEVIEWLEQALAYPGMRLLDLTPRIAVDSTQLPGEFHRDPADQIIVATARPYDIPLLTADRKIIDYPHVRTPTWLAAGEQGSGG
jgi:PIN domain nuclease of toxin-antitoxin system